MLAKGAIDELCQVGGDLRECKLALRQMDEAAEQATGQLYGISAPPSMSKVNEELTAAVAFTPTAACGSAGSRNRQSGTSRPGGSAYPAGTCWV